MLHTLTLLTLFLQDETPAGDNGEGASSPFGDLWVPLIGVIVIFYFVLIRPERRKQKARENLLGEMKKGDKVMTTSGIYGTIAQIQDDVVTLQVADGVRMRFARAAVQNLLEPSGGAAKDEKGDKAG